MESGQGVIVAFLFVGDKLEEFLRSLNSSRPLYLGQTGLGNVEELGKLGLEPGENFCMGGPGMIFSREVLRRMVPHIGECLGEMYTTHEDVEVGRCVRRFGGTQCVWSYEVRGAVVKMLASDRCTPLHSLGGRLIPRVLSLSSHLLENDSTAGCGHRVMVGLTFLVRAKACPRFSHQPNHSLQP